MAPLRLSIAPALCCLLLALSFVAVVCAEAPLHEISDRSKVVSGQYIVVLTNATVRDSVRRQLRGAIEGIGRLNGTQRKFSAGLQLNHTELFSYSNLLNGFAVRFNVSTDQSTEGRRFRGAVPDQDRKSGFSAALSALRGLSGVASVEEDSVVTASQTITTQTLTTGKQWGLDRIDTRSLTFDNQYGYDTNGQGVNVYVVDTGVRISHSEFQGRASNGYTAYSGVFADGNGHGTHVAGTVAGATYGVAKKANIVNVRVLDDSGAGSTSAVIAGLDWVVKNAVKPAVATMSLGGGASTALDNAVSAVINAGIPISVAAGNSNADACSYSPARVPAAVTVGATDNTDSRASYSNFGTCVDIMAPGSSILSSWSTSDTATNTISGTSMATPHVAGVLALLLQLNPTATPATLRTKLLAAATTGVLKSLSNAPNALLYARVATVAAAAAAADLSIQCPAGVTTAGCNGPTTLSFSSTSAQRVQFTASIAGLERGWLSYSTTSSTGKAIQFNFALQQYSTTTKAWTTLASVTDTTGSKFISYSITATGTYAWLITPASGSYVPSTASLSYKLAV